MIRKSTPIGEFVRKVVEEAFLWSEGFFGPVRDDRKVQNINYVYMQLTDGPPERFLDLLETTEDPQKIVEEAVKKIKGLSPSYEIQPTPGEFTKERFDEILAVKTAAHIIAFTFGGPEAGSRFSKLGTDLGSIYNFLKQKFEAALAESDNGNGQEIAETHFSLRDEEKAELIKTYSNALFSVHLLIRKISKTDTNHGQYL